MKFGIIVFLIVITFGFFVQAKNTLEVSRVGILSSCLFTDSFHWYDARRIDCQKFVKAMETGRIQIPKDIEWQEKK